MKKQNIAIIAVVAFVLAISVGYALFSETLQINGTATAKGNFDVEFIEAGEPKEKAGYTKQESSTLTTISDDGKKLKRKAELSEHIRELTINVDKLDYPGAYVVIPVKVENKGTISAILESISQSSDKDIEEPIKITYTGFDEKVGEENVLKANETQEFSIKVEWDPNDVDPSNKRDVTATFDVTLNYKQAVNQN